MNARLATPLMAFLSEADPESVLQQAEALSAAWCVQ
jgi:hypothetical protein